MKVINLTGQRFGRLPVIRQFVNNHRKSVCGVICKCGTYKEVRATRLRNPKANGKGTLSCGCLVREWAAQMNASHGMTASPEHKTWANCKSRTSNPKASNYEYYGGRGIQMCLGLSESFETFFRLVGLKPTPDHSIDRKENAGHYSCGECAECLENGWPFNLRWATRSQQMVNRRPMKRGPGGQVAPR